MLTEDQLQAQCFQYAHNNFQCLIFSVPNGGFRNKLEASKLKATGLTAGIPDLIILHQNTTTFIELKTPIGKLSPIQSLIHTKIQSYGHQVFTIRTFQEFQELIQQLGIPNKHQS